MSGTILVPEGASNTAALLDLDLAAIGRPSASGGQHILAALLANYPDREILIVGDNDGKDDGKWPGKSSAMRTAGHSKSIATDHQVGYTAGGVQGCKGVAQPEPKYQLQTGTPVPFPQRNGGSPGSPLCGQLQFRKVLVFSNFEFGESNGKPIKVGLMADNILDILLASRAGFQNALTAMFSSSKLQPVNCCCLKTIINSLPGSTRFARSTGPKDPTK